MPPPASARPSNAAGAALINTWTTETFNASQPQALPPHFMSLSQRMGRTSLLRERPRSPRPRSSEQRSLRWRTCWAAGCFLASTTEPAQSNRRTSRQGLTCNHTSATSCEMPSIRCHRSWQTRYRSAISRSAMCASLRVQSRCWSPEVARSIRAMRAGSFPSRIIAHFLSCLIGAARLNRPLGYVPMRMSKPRSPWELQAEVKWAKTSFVLW